jgi:hypothetical protein
MIKTRLFLIIMVCLLAFTAQQGQAGVTAEEAARLKTDLTPLGGERAGNAEGTIPAWTGGYTTVPAGYISGDPRIDPFADDKPLFSINSGNMSEHADKLCDGVQFMMNKHADYRIDVYPTHRPAAAPQRVYDNTFINATQASTEDDGLSLANAFGGTPFPIPKTGNEAMWNSMTYWLGEAIDSGMQAWMVTSKGKVILTNHGKVYQQYPYYYAHVTREEYLAQKIPEFWLLRMDMVGPPYKVGESFAVREPIDYYKRDRRAWQYLLGQRRVRRAPSISYDTPDDVASGQTVRDEAFIFNGSQSRYDWKLVGKKEMYVPYNQNGFHLQPVEAIINPGKAFVNPDYLRWELHRVWEVEATLAEGKRHLVPRRKFYLDEDTWMPVLYDGWDKKGNMFRHGIAHPATFPDLPATLLMSWTMYNLQSGVRASINLINDVKVKYKSIEPRDQSFFTPEALAGEGIR